MASERTRTKTGRASETLAEELRPDLYSTALAPCEEVTTCLPWTSPVPRSGHLTQSIIARFCDQIRRGHRRMTACDALRINRNAYQTWMRRGKEEIRLYDAGYTDQDRLTIFAQFVLATAEAEAEFHERIVDKVIECGDPVVLLRYLRARFPKHYHHDGRVVVDDETAEEIVAGNPVEQIEARITQLRAAVNASITTDVIDAEIEGDG